MINKKLTCVVWVVWNVEKKMSNNFTTRFYHPIAIAVAYWTLKLEDNQKYVAYTH